MVWMWRLEMFSCPLRLVRYLSTPSLFGQSLTKKSLNPRESLPQLSEERVLPYTVDADTHHNYIKHPGLQRILALTVYLYCLQLQADVCKP